MNLVPYLDLPGMSEQPPLLPTLWYKGPWALNCKVFCFNQAGIGDRAY